LVALLVACSLFTLRPPGLWNVLFFHVETLFLELFTPLRRRRNLVPL